MTRRRAAFIVSGGGGGDAAGGPCRLVPRLRKELDFHAAACLAWAETGSHFARRGEATMELEIMTPDIELRPGPIGKEDGTPWPIRGVERAEPPTRDALSEAVGLAAGRADVGRAAACH